MTEINFNSAAALRSFLDENGLGMRKKYGQNFLVNPAVRNALVHALEAQQGESVWEIGPGLGAMTDLLLEQELEVRAFEVDPGFVRILKERYKDKARFTLVEGDVLKTWPDEPESVYLLGNLPYNIAAALLSDFIEQGRFFKRIVVTVQREVARRMAALPGSADYSSFSVLCASAYRVKPLMVIKGDSFYPRPNVDSQAVALDVKEDAARERPACLYPLIRQLFSSRRKTLKNNVTRFLSMHSVRSMWRPQRSLSLSKGARGVEALEASEALEAAGIDGKRRAEDLSIDDFERLAQTMENMRLL